MLKVTLLKLARATTENNFFQKLRAEWDQQMKRGQEISPEDYYQTMMDHAEKISKEYPQDKKYGIFILAESDKDGGIGSCEGMVHVNHAWPKTADPTLRLVWNLIAPRYQFEDENPTQLAAIMTGFVLGALELCDGDMRSKKIKLYLGNAIDRQYASVAMGFLGQSVS